MTSNVPNKRKEETSRTAYAAIKLTKETIKAVLANVHDLKTGLITGSMHQLEVYAALFCLEYDIKPGQIGIELRIYQNDEIEITNPDVDVIAHVMDKIIVFDRLITTYQIKG